MKFIKPLIFPIIILLLWQVLTQFNLVNLYLLPPPSAVFAYLISSIGDGTIFANIFASISRIFIGFAISFMIAAPLGILYGNIKSLQTYLYPALEFIRHIPPLAFLSVLILVFGIGEASKIALIITAAFFPIFMNCANAVESVDKKLIEVGKSFKFSKIKIFWHISRPCAFPVIFTGMQLGMGYSFRALIGAEMLAAASGMGYMIRNAESFMRSDIVFAGIIAIGILGLIIDLLFKAIAKMCFPHLLRSKGGAK
ncbi:MAG: ABC transporter permease [Elusimicrobiota bacterium]|jgi:sulfonate transport system permease protein|nr:ABC transporter permease [Elusimicrobiota bacterium]